MKEVLLQKNTKSGIKCLNCAQLCTLQEKEFGKCGMRQVKNGELKVHNYGKVEVINIDPIEKKPIYHFLPGTKTLSFSASGCSFKCKNCQNWRLSQKNNGQTAGKFIYPEEMIEMALKKKVKSISYTYGEPIIFLEYALDVMKVAQKKGIKNIWVTNGYFSDQSLKIISPYIDAINIDLKSFSDNFYRTVCDGRIQPVLNSIKKIYRTSWLEITTLIIPNLNDSSEELNQIATFIADINKNIPWHILKFSSKLAKNMNHPNTPEKTIEKAYKIGKKAGLNHIYPGNTVTDKMNTYCHNCGELIIERNGYRTQIHSEKIICKNCKQKINLILK